jgi:hypothetical protein
MVLHEKDSVRDYLEDDVYASENLSLSMPKYRFPDLQHDPRQVYSVVHDELMLDGNSRQNLATFCQTWVEPEVHKLLEFPPSPQGTGATSGRQGGGDYSNATPLLVQGVTGNFPGVGHVLATHRVEIITTDRGPVAGRVSVRTGAECVWEETISTASRGRPSFFSISSSTGVLALGCVILPHLKGPPALSLCSCESFVMGDPASLVEGLIHHLSAHQGTWEDGRRIACNRCGVFRIQGA